jgi:hypothetical protein
VSSSFVLSFTCIFSLSPILWAHTRTLHCGHTHTQTH